MQYPARTWVTNLADFTAFDDKNMTKHSWFRSEKFFFITFFLQDLHNTWDNFVARPCNAGISSTLFLYLLCNLRNSALPLPCSCLSYQILVDIFKKLKKTKHRPKKHTFQKYVPWAKLCIYIVGFLETPQMLANRWNRLTVLSESIPTF